MRTRQIHVGVDQSETTTDTASTPGRPKATPDATTRRNALANASAPSSMRASLVDDMELLNVILLQWSYLNKRASQAFSNQEDAACQIIDGVFRHIQGMKAPQNDAELELATLEHARRVDTVLDAMEGGVIKLGSLVPTLTMHHSRISSAVRPTINVLPTTGLGVNGPIECAITECTEKVCAATRSLHNSFPAADSLAKRLAELRNAVEAEMAAVAACYRELDTAQSLVISEKSLKAQEQQLYRLLKK